MAFFSSIPPVGIQIFRRKKSLLPSRDHRVFSGAPRDLPGLFQETRWNGKRESGRFRFRSLLRSPQPPIEILRKRIRLLPDSEQAGMMLCRELNDRSVFFPYPPAESDGNRIRRAPVAHPGIVAIIHRLDVSKAHFQLHHRQETIFHGESRWWGGGDISRPIFGPVSVPD